MSMKGEKNNTTKNEDDFGKNKQNKKKQKKQIKIKKTFEENTKVDEVKLNDLEGVNEAFTKWQEYKIVTLIAIRGDIKKNMQKQKKQDINQ